MDLGALLIQRGVLESIGFVLAVILLAINRRDE